LSFNEDGIDYNNAVFVPWNLLVELINSGKTLKINYIGSDSEKIHQISIRAWSKNYARFLRELHKAKKEFAPDKVACPSCKKELLVDAEAGKMIYSCEKCNIKYFKNIY
jgi:ribosomal protein L37AE/L43A